MYNVVQCVEFRQRFLWNVESFHRFDKLALVDGFEGRRSLELISAIYESVETAKVVQLRFLPKECRLGLRAD